MGGNASLQPVGSLGDRLINGATTQATARMALELLTMDASQLWRDHKKAQPMAHEWWLVMMHWLMATTMFYASPTAGKDGRQVNRDVYDIVMSLCNNAEAFTNNAVKHESRLDSVDQLPRSRLVDLPPMTINRDTVEGVWAVIYATYTRTEEDLQRFGSDTLPKRFVTLAQELKQAATQNQRMLVEYNIQWSQVQSVDEKIRIAQAALAHARALFVNAQQWLVPAMLGRPYELALYKKPSLEELDIAFDPWVLTAPMQAKKRRNQTADQQQLADFWTALPTTGEAYQISIQLKEAVRKRRIRTTTVSYDYVPWPSQYLVRFPVTFGPRTFQCGDLIGVFVNFDDKDHPVQVRKTGRVNTIAGLLGQRTS